MMGNYYLIILAMLVLPFLIDSAFAQTNQTITVNQTTPCFINYSARYDMWKNCGYDEDYIQAALLPWEWITGGNFSLIIVSIFTLVSYIKYHKAVYPIVIGVMFLPIAYFVFPDAFLSWSFLMAGALFGIMIWYIFIRQTKEYGG